MSWFKEKVESFDMAGMALAREMQSAGPLVVEETEEEPVRFIEYDGDAAVRQLAKETADAQKQALKTIAIANLAKE